MPNQNEPTNEPSVSATGSEPDYKAMLEQARRDLEAAQAETERWKAQSRKNEGRAKTNAEAAKGYEDATQQLADLSERLAAIEGENARLKAAAARAEVVSKVAAVTGVPEAIVSSLAASDEKALTEAATAIAEAYRTPGGAPTAPEAGTFPKGGEAGAEGADWLREALTNK